MHIYSSFSIIFKIELPLVRSPRCSCLQSRHLFGKEDRIFQFHMDDNHNDHNNNNQIKNITIQTQSCGHKIKIMQPIKWEKKLMHQLYTLGDLSKIDDVFFVSNEIVITDKNQCCHNRNRVNRNVLSECQK